MSYKISEIEGIGPARASTLAEAGITTTDHLLEHCADAKGRAAVAEKTQFSAAQLLKWANMADLMRISGVAGEYAELLEAAGVDTVKELRTRRPDNLAAKMAEVNAEKKLVRAVPTEASVTKWVEQAKEMEPRITH
jgi:predicted flap endonuclease-1-like 5' DNA nuclease